MALDQALNKTVSESQQPRPFASHRICQYLSRRYKVDIESVVWEPHEFPADRQWQALRRFHGRFATNRMLWKKKPPPEITRRPVGMKITAVVFDPCSNRPESSDFLQINIDTLRQAYSRHAAP
ncbi:MAG TPA: hypothetical protein VMW70_15360 [Burkholderiales bacterium]|nr:hypothetical protein [Burkholderiales bacterium]